MQPIFAKIINEQCGFITAEDKEELMPGFSQLEVLIRTGSNRYLCPLEDVEKVFEIVEGKGDYVRDVSLTADNCQRIRNGQLWKGRVGGDVKQCHPDA